MMSVEENLPDLPTDLIIEIFSRLPSKSIARCRCLSKLWASLLTPHSPYFTELFLTRSVTRPRLLFTVHRRNDHKWYLYSSPQPQISHKNSMSSLTVTAEFQTSFPKPCFQISPPFSGLIYYRNIQNSKGLQYPVVCNPRTGQILCLPTLKNRVCSYFGYDPIDKQFSVLSISSSLQVGQEFPLNFQILTLRSGKLFSRNLTCPLQHLPWEGNTCINGVLYYTAYFTLSSRHKIVCFDLNSEEFKFIDQPWIFDNLIDLVNFKGKLCGIKMMWVQFGSERYKLDLLLWILEDFEKQEWSKHLYCLSLGFDTTHVYVVGVSATGDIVLSSYNTSNPFYIYLFNPEKNTVQEVEVKGLEDCNSNMVNSFVDYGGNLRIF